MSADVIAAAIERLQADLDAAKKPLCIEWWADQTEIYGGTEDAAEFDAEGDRIWIGETCSVALGDYGSAVGDHIARHSPAVEIPRLEAMLTILRDWSPGTGTGTYWAAKMACDRIAEHLARAIVEATP